MNQLIRGHVRVFPELSAFVPLPDDVVYYQHTLTVGDLPFLGTSHWKSCPFHCVLCSRDAFDNFIYFTELSCPHDLTFFKFLSESTSLDIILLKQSSVGGTPSPMFLW